MKKILFLLVGLALSAQAAPTLSHLIRGNVGQSVPLFGAQRNGEPSPASIVNLDTSEIDTSKYFYQLLEKPIVGAVDTVGFVHFAFKDSSGTDSARVRIIWYGNARADGLGLWSKIDSVTASGTSISSRGRWR